RYLHVAGETRLGFTLMEVANFECDLLDFSRGLTSEYRSPVTTVNADVGARLIAAEIVPVWFLGPNVYPQRVGAGRL
ncbi:MAG: hypothetical protein WBN68_11355, partial [Sedimenticolaceae bacterium]